jgi:hypothetical protein
MFIAVIIFISSTDSSILSVFLGGYFFWSKEHIEKNTDQTSKVNIFSYWSAFIALGIIAYPKIPINIFFFYVTSILIMGIYLLVNAWLDKKS